MAQIETTAMIKDVFHSEFTWRIEDYKQIVEEGLLDKGNKLKTKEIEMVGIPIKWHLSHKLEVENSRRIAKFYFRIVTSSDAAKQYEKTTCKFKIVSDDSPLMNFQQHGPIAPFIGFWKAMRLERFDWAETKVFSSTGLIHAEKSIGAINLFSSVKDDGALEIKCDIEITGLKMRTDSGRQTMRQSSKSVSKLALDIGKLLSSGEFSDVTLVVQGQEIKVHQLILAARSPVFSAMLSVDMKEKRERCITIPDVSHEAAKEFLDFIYSANMKGTKNAKELLILAEMYQIKDLKQACENLLITQLNNENALDNLFVANLYNCKQELKNKSFEIIANQILGPLYKISPDLMNKPEVIEMMVNVKLTCDDVHSEVQRTT